MEGLPFSREYLESLTTNDLLALSDNLGIDVPDNLDRISLIEELLEITSHDGAGFFHSIEPELHDTVIVESVPLPKHYNITFIEVMMRDPLWAFVFWEIKAQDKDQFEKAQDFEGYYLKVSPLNGSANNSNKGQFTVPVSPNDAAWYLSLSADSGDETGDIEKNSWTQSQFAQSQFKVEICVKLGAVETVLAESNPVRLPGLPEFPPAAGKPEGALANGSIKNQLVRLSGYGDLKVLRKNERQLRVKRESESQNE